MGGLVSGLFGGGKTKSTTTASSVPIKYSAPKNFGVTLGGRSALSVNGNTGSVKLGASPVDAYAKRVTNSLGGQRTRLNRDIVSLGSNQNDYINARVRPMEQQLAEQLSSQDQSFAQRGIFGSLADNEQTKARFLGQQAIGDERAKATDEALSKLFDAETTLRGVNQDEMGVAETKMKDELARLGISLEALNASLGDQKKLTEVAGGTTTTKAPTDILGGIGKIIGIASSAATLSDRRAKKDIERLPFEVCGLPFYTFTYLWGEKSAGFMADEVKEKYPQAIEECGGYMFVKYVEVLNAVK